MAKNSREKGKRGELEACEFLKGHGFEARRAQQYSGANGDSDILTNIPGVHVEVKRAEVAKPYAWIDQAVGDAKPGDDPVVLHRQNNREWIVMMPAENFLKIMRELMDANAELDGVANGPRVKP